MDARDDGVIDAPNPTPIDDGAVGDGGGSEGGGSGERGDGMDDESPGQTGGRGSRDVVVPLSLYKVVTVFSTLIAVVAIVGGFVALDVATRRATAPASEIDPILAAVGLLSIAAGGAVYAFAARFRAPGMGTPKNGDDEGTDDG